MIRNLKLWRVLPLLLVFATFAYAADQAQLPIVVTAGVPGCPTCKTTTAGVNPIADADLPSQTSAQVKAHVSDETGSGGPLVFGTGPTLTTPILDDPSLTGDVDMSTADSVAYKDGSIAIEDIDSADRAGDGTKVATTTTPGANGNLALWDTAGKLVDGGAPTSGTRAIINFESQFPIPAGNVNTYVSAGSNISATSANAQSLAVENMTLGSPCCWVYTGTTTGTLVVTLQSGTYGGALTPSTVTVTLAAQNTAVCDSTNSLAITAGQGYNVLVDGDASTTEGQLRGGCARTL